MKIVERANVQLRIEDEELQEYIARGFKEVILKTSKEVKEIKKK